MHFINRDVPILNVEIALWRVQLPISRVHSDVPSNGNSARKSERSCLAAHLQSLGMAT